MPSLDTNVLLRLFLQDNISQYQAAIKTIRSYDKIALADTCIQEAVFVLEKVYKLEREAVGVFINTLLNNQHLNFNRPMYSRALPIYLGHLKLSFYDCCLAIYADLNGDTPLLTCDKNLAKQLPDLTKLLV